MTQAAAPFCLHCIVSGDVQGVFYRASTQQQARLLGVTGWVRNCSDGTVEALACGDESTVRKLERWLWQGPVQSNVSDVKSTVVAESRSFDTFEIV